MVVFSWVSKPLGFTVDRFARSGYQKRLTSLFFPTAAAASVAGYRPCLRCGPEVSPGTPAWRGTSTTVSRALQMIAEGALDEQSVKQLCERLGVSERHLSRLFSKHLGASPATIAKTRRLQFAKKLVDETDLPMTEIAMSSGYGSVRRFNDHFKKTYGRNPNSLRNKPSVGSEGTLTMSLPFRAPFDFRGLIGFFAARAIPGVETVTADQYSRSIQLEGKPAQITLTKRADYISCQLLLDSPASLIGVAEKVKRLFDLDAIPSEIEKVLCRDKDLGRLVRKNPGVRLPGAWDPFETSIRAIVGQQISVKGATTIMGRLAENYGQRSPFCLQFPQPEQLCDIDVEALPMPKARATAISEFARAVREGRVDFDADLDCLRQQLLDLPGIGPWTAEYILMRRT